MTDTSTCTVEDRLLWEWVVEGLAAPGLDLAAHVRDCATCAERVAEIQRLEDGLAALDATPLPRVPARIGPYSIVRSAGEGGMGLVYEARQETPQRRVALKVLRHGRATSASMRRGLAREARVLARLSHPGIATIHDAGATDDGRPYIVVEFVDGRPIDRHAEERALSAAARVELLAHVARAVHHAHQRGVLHCDLKPANVLVDGEGRPHVVDFGLARPAVEELGWSLSLPLGELAGTVPFMSPEQARGDAADVDVRTDVYGLGALAYSVLVGTAPNGASPSSDGTRSRTKPAPPHPSDARSGVPRELGDVVLQALRTEPDERYESAAAFADDLDRFLEGSAVRARRASPAYRLRVLLRRNKAATAAVLLVAGLLCTTALAAWRARLDAERQRDDVVAALALLTETLRAGGDAADAELLSGANAALRAVGERLRTGVDFPSDSLAAATLHAEVGRVYRSLGWSEGDAGHEELALRHTLAALQTRRIRLGEDHPDTVASLYELTNVLPAGEDAEARRILERIERRYRAGRVRPCLGLARSLLELSRQAPVERREGLAHEASAMLRRIAAPPRDVLAAARRLAQIAYERGDADEGARRAVRLRRAREDLGVSDDLDHGRVTIEPGGRIRLTGPGPDALWDDDEQPDDAPGCSVRVGSDTLIAATNHCGGMNCGSGHWATLDLAPREDDPAPLVQGADVDVALLAGTLFHPPVDADPFVDNVHLRVRLLRVFDPSTERIDVSLGLMRSRDACAWSACGSLEFTEPLFVVPTDDRDVRVVTTRDPSGAAGDADRVDLVLEGEVIATYRIPLTMRAERVPFRDR